MVIVPVDAEIDEAQHVAQEYWKQGAQSRELDPMGDLHLQHHDGHDDREYGIAECFHSRLAHASAPANVFIEPARAQACLCPSRTAPEIGPAWCCWRSAQRHGHLPAP